MFSAFINTKSKTWKVKGFFENSKSFSSTLWKNLLILRKSIMLSQSQKIYCKVEEKSSKLIQFLRKSKQFWRKTVLKKNSFFFIKFSWLCAENDRSTFQWYFLIFRLTRAKFPKVFDFQNILSTVVWYTWAYF